MSSLALILTHPELAGFADAALAPIDFPTAPVAKISPKLAPVLVASNVELTKKETKQYRPIDSSC